ncbi:MAG: 2-oxoacid:ferredoxin oxidoreductase subunit beta [Candidatus Eisenbacteria bacterium]
MSSSAREAHEAATTETADAAAFTAKDYKGRIKPIWCPGCGDYGVLNSLLNSLAHLRIPPEQLAVVSGIGCSSRLPGFVKCYGFHGVHGRALPVALGVKLGNPRLTVIVAGGDGDGLSIGAGHFPHVARRNIDITYLMLDNRIYGLTKGQTSPTTPQGIWTKTAPHGVIEYPMNPAALALCYSATFVSRGYSNQLKQLQEIITAAIRHRGFSLVQILTPCVTFGKGCGFDVIAGSVKDVPETHDLQDTRAAYMLATDPDHVYTGIFYREERPELVDMLQQQGGTRGREVDDSDPKIDVQRLIGRFS